MNIDSSEVTVKGVMPTSNGCAIFLGNDSKSFVIYVDPSIGNAINMTMNQVKKERPLTHDLIGLILKGLEASIERVLINDVDEGTFFARIILKKEFAKNSEKERTSNLRFLEVGAFFVHFSEVSISH